MECFCPRKHHRFRYFIHRGRMVLNSTSGSPEDWEPEVWIGNEATGGNMVTSEKTAGTKLFTAWFPTVLAVVSNVVFLYVICKCQLRSPFWVPAFGNLLVFLIIVIFEAVTQGVNATSNEKTTTSVFLMVLCLLFFWFFISLRYDQEDRTQHQVSV